MICNEYLEEQYPEPALLPTDSYERAQARLLMDDYNKVMEGAVQLHNKSVSCVKDT